MNRHIVLLLAAWPAVALAQAPVRGAPAAPEIVATGSASVSLPPDRASMMVSVTVRHTSATEAGRLNAERMASVLAALRRQGIPDSALTTSGFSIEVEDPGYDQPAPPIDEPSVYSANNSVRITFSTLELIGRVVDTVLAAGASGVDGISYASSQNSAGRRRAIALAVAEARGDAEAAAAAAGGRLGPLLELTLTPTYSFRGAAAASLYGGSAETSILVPTSVTESATAVMRFSFIPGR